MYNISSTEWTWLSGNTTVNAPGVYGTKGIPSINSYPGGRERHSMAFDSKLNCIYVFGGKTISGGELDIRKFAHLSLQDS
jgi:hypothetical protein